MKVGDLLRRPAGVIISHLEPGLHPLNVGALLEEVLIGAVVLEQVEQQQQTVLHHNTCSQDLHCSQVYRHTVRFHSIKGKFKVKYGHVDKNESANQTCFHQLG